MNDACVLVRLLRIGADALRDFVTGAHRYVGAKARKSRSTVSRPNSRKCA